MCERPFWRLCESWRVCQIWHGCQRRWPADCRITGGTMAYGGFAETVIDRAVYLGSCWRWKSQLPWRSS